MRGQTAVLIAIGFVTTTWTSALAQLSAHSPSLLAQNQNSGTSPVQSQAGTQGAPEGGFNGPGSALRRRFGGASGTSGGPGSGMWFRGGAAGAQGGAATGQSGAMGGQAGASEQAREEMRQKMITRFDTNHDGVLNDQEKTQMRAYIEKMRAQRQAAPGASGAPSVVSPTTRPSNQ